jgi:carbonic anhydrase
MRSKWRRCSSAPSGAGAARAEGAGPHWGYSADNGPAHWGSEDPAFATCDLGKRQSPIDIEHATRQALPPIEFAYQPTPLVVTDTGHSFQVNAAPGSGAITVGGQH